LARQGSLTPTKATRSRLLMPKRRDNKQKVAKVEQVGLIQRHPRKKARLEQKRPTKK